MAKGIKIRNEQEQLAFDTMIKAHEFLCKKLKVSTDLTFQRECNWGKNARHAGWYRSADKLVALNFRNMYGATIGDLLEVLGHEMRHAVQDAKGWHKLTMKNRSNYLRGTWKGQDMFISYQDAPWEIDARKYEKPYAAKVIKGLGLSKDVLNTRLPMGTLTKSNKNATYRQLDELYTRDGYFGLANSWSKTKRKESGLVYVLKSDLPKGFSFKKREDADWLYDNQQLLRFIPWVKVTEEYGGFSVRQMVS